MSWEPLVCSKCEVDAEFERYGRLDQPHSVGVAWLCRSCGARLLDVVPVGVDAPEPGCCLNCGAEVDDAGSCGACGLPRPPLIAAIHEQCGDPPSLGAAERLAARGLFRLAINALDLRLESLPDDADAWLAKARMLAGVGLGARAIVSLDRALPRLDPETRVSLLPARAELLCELLRDHEALATIEEALEHMPDNPRAIYTHGRALALLGRLADARASMARVLELEPDNQAAGRALAQIDAALAEP